MREKSYFELVVTVFQKTPKALQSIALGCPPRHGRSVTIAQGMVHFRHRNLGPLNSMGFFLICKEMPWEHIVMYDYYPKNRQLKRLLSG